MSITFQRKLPFILRINSVAFWQIYYRINMSCRTIVGRKAIKMIPKTRKVGIVSTYNIPCGIAEHTKYFAEQLQTQCIILAEDHPTPIYPDNSYVIRCWTRDFNDYNSLLNTIMREKVNIVDIQFEFSFYHNTDNLLKFLTLLKARNVKTIITFHTMVEYMANCINTLGDTCDGIIVTSQTMIKPDWLRPGVKRKMKFIPLPVPILADQDRHALRRKYNIESNHVVSSFGFLVWHKGMLNVVEQIYEVKKYIPDIKYLIIGCHGDTYYDQLVETVKRLELQNSVTFYDEFYSIDKLFELLHISDLIVMNYHVAHPTSSGAVKIALASHRTVLGSSSMMFDDVPHDVMQRVPMGDSNEMGRHIRSMLGDPARRDLLENKGYQFAQSISSERIAHLHDEYYKQIRGY